MDLSSLLIKYYRRSRNKQKLIKEMRREAVQNIGRFAAKPQRRRSLFLTWTKLIVAIEPRAARKIILNNKLMTRVRDIEAKVLPARDRCCTKLTGKPSLHPSDYFEASIDPGTDVEVKKYERNNPSVHLDHSSTRLRTTKATTRVLE